MFEITPLSVASFAIIFSHSYGCLFTLRIVFKFNQVPFVYFCFYFQYSGRWVIEDPAVIYVRVFCLCSPLGVLQFLVLVSGSLIHFEFIFVYGVRKCSNFILLQAVDQFSQHHLLKRLSFSHCISLSPLSKIRCPQVRGLVSGLSILFH